MVVVFNLLLIGLLLLILGGYLMLLTEFVSDAKYWADPVNWIIAIGVTFLAFGVSIGLVLLLGV